MTLVSLDLETHLIQPGLLSPSIVCGSLATGKEKSLLTSSQALAEFEAWINTKHVIVGANISFDFGCIAAVRPDLIPAIFAKFERGEVHDILIAQALDAIAKGYFRDKMIVDPRTGTSIRKPNGGSQSKRYSQDIVVDLVLGRTNAKENDAYRMSYATLERIPHSEWPEVARKYPVDDAVNALEVAEAQLKTHENLHDMPAQCRAAWAEHLAAMWGLRTDRVRVAALKAKLEADRTPLMAEVQKLGIFRADGTKDTKVLKALVAEAYLGEPPRTPTGEVKTDATTLEDADSPPLLLMNKLAKGDKLLNTYLPFLESGIDKPINVKPNILLANGRSSYEGLVQLLPRRGGVRDCFTARPGTLWCSVDYSAIEMNTLAEACLATVGRSKLADAINAGKDVHSLFAAEIYGAQYEDAVKLKETDPVWKDRRQMTKAANFGYPGCMGAFKFAQQKRKEGLRLCLAARTATKCGVKMIREWKGNEYPAPACEACVLQAEKLRLAFFAMWPEVKEYIAWITNSLERSDRLTQLFSGRVRGGLQVPSGANTLFSGLAGDGAKRALWAVSRECYTDETSPLYGSRVVVFAHDEIIVEMPESRAHEAAMRQTELMIQEMQKATPHVTVRAEPALMRYWYKDAAPVFDANKRLIPWSPE